MDMRSKLLKNKFDKKKIVKLRCKNALWRRF